MNQGVLTETKRSVSNTTQYTASFKFFIKSRAKIFPKIKPRCNKSPNFYKTLNPSNSSSFIFINFPKFESHLEININKEKVEEDVLLSDVFGAKRTALNCLDCCSSSTQTQEISMHFY